MADKAEPSALIPFLDQVDHVFGWTGVSVRFPNSWKLTTAEVDLCIQKQIDSYLQRSEKRKKGKQ